MKKLFGMSILFSLTAFAATVDLSEQQWALKNNNESITINKPSEIKLQKVPVVAVFDFGLDYEHPDLAHAILKNEKECDGEKDSDDDGNGYIDDCFGLDLSSNDNNVKDASGHGTHVAGIISAKNDGEGISGVDDRIKILPVKIFSGSTKPFRVSSDDPQSIASIIVKGIDYAITREVDVINISAGWLNKMHASKIEAAIKKANDNNILIVAAAGNNRNSSHQYPCGLDGVLCVGSVGPTGQISSFSNYGGMVDIYAAGENIISTYPTYFVPESYTVTGYEKYNGTSQAAPYVSAAAALIKGANKGITNDRVIQKLLEGATTLKSNKVDTRILNISRALQQKDVPSYYPNLKDNALLKVDKSLKFDILLPIKNYSQRVSSLSMSCSTDHENIKNLSCRVHDNKKSFTVSGKLSDLSASNSFELDITLNVGRKTKKFQKSFYLVQDFDSSDVKRIVLPAGIPSINKIASVESFGLNDSSSYFSMAKKNDLFQLNFYKYESDKFQKKLTYEIKDLVSLYKIVKVKKDDILEHLVVYSTKVSKDVKRLSVAYFSEDFSSHQKTISVEVDRGVKLSNERMSFITNDNRLLVGFYTTSFLLNEDYDSASWGKTFLDLNFDRREVGQHIFYVSETGFKAYDNEKFYEKLYSEMDLGWMDKVWFNATPVLLNDVPAYELSVESFGTTTRYVTTLNINNRMDLTQLNNDGFDIGNPNTIKVNSFNRETNQKNTIVTKVNGKNIINVFDYNLDQTFQYTQNDSMEDIQSIVGGVNLDDETVIFYETQKNMAVFSSKNPDHVSTIQLDRLNFFQGNDQARFQNAIAKYYHVGSTLEKNQSLPSVFVDFSSINANFVSTAVYRDGDLTRELRYSFEIPKNCLTGEVLTFNNQKYLPLTCKKSGKETQYLKPL